MIVPGGLFTYRCPISSGRGKRSEVVPNPTELWVGCRKVSRVHVPIIIFTVPNTSCLCLVIAGEQEATGRTGRGKSITATLGLVVHAAGKDTHLL